MRCLIIAAFYILICGATIQSVLAGEISSPLQNNFLFYGEIQKGDAEKLIQSFKQANPYPMQLILDSPGGDVEESIRISSLTKALHMTTVVKGDSVCASACFFIFLSGDFRLAAGTIDGKMYKSSPGFIGLHRPYLKSDQSNLIGSSESVARQHNVMQKMREYLSQQDVPQRLIDIMMSRPSNDIYWMSQDDIDQLGTYSPGLEELLISRCGYSRHMIADITKERTSDNSETAAQGLEHLKAFAICSNNSFPDLIAESISVSGKLKKGWRPWSKASSKKSLKAS